MFSTEHFARALRKCRAEHGITQQELAQRLHVTPQLISKWEREEGVPGLENLCALAEIFSVTVDALLQPQKIGEQTFIGIAGDVRKRFALVNERGSVLNSIVIDGAPFNGGGAQTLAEQLRQGIDYLHPQTMNVQGIFFVGGGVQDDGDSLDNEVVLRAMRERYPDIRMAICNAVPVLQEMSGQPAERTLVIVGGRTCCVSYWFPGETFVRIGRGGYLGRPSGSRYNIGHDALMAVCEAQDGVGPQTALKDMLENWLGGGHIKNYLSHIANRGPGFIADFARLVSLAAERGDAVAEQILLDNSGYLARLIHRAHKKTPQADCVVLSGTLFTAENERFYQMLRRQVDPGLTLMRVTEPLVWSACCRAAELCQAGGQMSIDNFVASDFGNDSLFQTDM